MCSAAAKLNAFSCSYVFRLCLQIEIIVGLFLLFYSRITAEYIVNFQY